MKITDPLIAEKAQQLLRILDKDALHLQKTFGWLDQLRTAVVKRDETTLSQLLIEIRNESEEYSSNESQRQEIRQEMAVLLECSIEQMNLSKLEGVLDYNLRTEIHNRKNSLNILAGRFRNELQNTTKLLSDCARFNYLLLKTVFKNLNSDTITYQRDGAATNIPKAAFINTKF